jgi:hypothetical protein
VLRLNFRAGRGEAPKLVHATFARFCVDGTLRGPDNYVIARCAESGWWVGGDLHRLLECEGPLCVRVAGDRRVPAADLGPFRVVSAAGGVLYGDETCLHLPVPGAKQSGVPARQLTLLSEGSRHGEAERPARKAAAGSSR